MMTAGQAWSGILESLQSAFIDEVTERHPEPKPVLGLPLRHAGFQPPAQGLAAISSREAQVELGSMLSQGIALLAFDEGFLKAIGHDPATLWIAILKRAEAEFKRRGLAPKFAEAQQSAGDAGLPSSGFQPTRVIWMPFELEIPSERRCFLGVGI